MLWLWNFFLHRRQFSYVLVGTLIVAGSFALLRIPKENAPAVVIPEGIVITTLPGASASDMETLVTNKLEDQISGISNIDTMTSFSGDGVSHVMVQFVASADINQSIQDLRDAAAKAVPDLPKDATAPSVIKINFSDQPIIVVSVAGDLPPSEFSTLQRKSRINSNRSLESPKSISRVCRAAKSTSSSVKRLSSSMVCDSPMLSGRSRPRMLHCPREVFLRAASTTPSILKGVSPTLRRYKTLLFL